MLPIAGSKGSPAVRTFEVITPAGCVHQFPRPSLLRRLLMLLQSYADTMAVSAFVFGVAYFAGVLVESIPQMASECRN